MGKLGLLLVALILSGSCFGHSYSTSYLRITQQANALNSEWKIPLADLDRSLDLDLNKDKKISAEEVVQSQQRISSYAMRHLTIEQNRLPCQTSNHRFALDTIDSNPAVYIEFRALCKSPISETHPLTLNYQLFQRENPWHQGIVSITSPNGLFRYVLSHNKTSLTLAQGNTAQSSFLSFLMEGIWHIYIGLDHILFLLTLILPVVLHRVGKRGFEAESLPPLYKQLLSIVTAFTLAHSVTLILAASDSCKLPAQIVETGIALSVVVGAILALFPAFDRWRWLLALGFGFIHGFGFANVLAQLMNPQQSVFLDLIGFNIGVELGQISIVAIAVPVLLLLARHSLSGYRLLLPSMSVIIGFGALWVLQRGFGLVLALPV